MLEEQDKPKKYGNKYFSNPTPPPPHNPMIGSMQGDTLCNVRDGLCLIRELAEVPDFSPTERTMMGFHFLMTTMINALSFEIENRK